VLDPRLSLLHESGHAFLLIGHGEHGMEYAPLERMPSVSVVS
jgi:hypothetical protein